MIDTETSKEYEYQLIDQQLIDIYKSDTISIYQNDLKHKNKNQIDIKRVKNNDNAIDFDTIEFRLDDCLKTGCISLDLSHLNLKQFPLIPTILHKKLRYLFVSENELRVIGNLSYLEELIVLDVCDNKLDNIPILPEKLEELLITNNNIKDIESLSQYDYLKRLDCSGNQIINIPIIDSLEILVCNNNKIKNIPDLKKLKKLSCSNNKLNELNKFPNLEILECDNNNINQIINYKNLKELYCSENDISHIKNLNKLEILHCYKTNVKKIEYYETLKELICDSTDDFLLSGYYTIINSDMYLNKILSIRFK